MTVVPQVTQPPVFTPPDPLADQRHRPTRNGSIPPRRSTPQHYALTYDLPVGPNGLGVDPATGTLGWIPTVNDLGPHDVLLRVIDSHGAYALAPTRLIVYPRQLSTGLHLDSAGAVLNGGSLIQTVTAGAAYCLPGSHRQPGSRHDDLLADQQGRQHVDQFADRADPVDDAGRRQLHDHDRRLGQ